MDHRLEFESRKLLHSCPSLSINLQNYNLRVGTLTFLSKFKYQPADSLKIVTLMALFKFLLIQCLEMNPAFQQIATHMVACRGNRTGWWARGSTGFLYRRSLPLKKIRIERPSSGLVAASNQRDHSRLSRASTISCTSVCLQ